MDKELLDLLNQARQSGANETQLQGIVDSYNLKKKSSSGAPTPSSNGQSTSQSQETNAPNQPDFNFINRKGESTLHVGDDPLGNTVTQLQSKKDNLINSGTDATSVTINKPVNIGGKGLANTPKEDEINRLDADIQDIKQNAFADPNKAQDYLKQKLNGKPVIAKNDVIGQQQPLTPNTDLLNTDLNSVKQSLNSGNLTDQLAFNRVKKEQDINDALSGSQNITDAAIKYNAAQNPQVQRQVQFLQQHGQQLPDVYEGQMVANFLNDPDVIQKARNDPNFASQYADEQRMLLLQHPEYGKRVVASKISQAREDAGLNNPIVNIPTQESTDKIVADLVQKGQLTPTEQSIYENQIKPSLGVMQSIGRGVGRLIPGAQAAIDESPISTPGFLENAENSYVNTLHGMAHSIEDVGQLGNRMPTTQDAGRLKQVLQNDYSNVVIDPKGAWNSLGQSSGQFTGFVLPMIMGGTATKALGVGATASELIPQGLVFEGQNKDNAVKMFPNDPSEQFMYTTLATAGDLMLGKLIPTGEAKEGVRTLLKDDIKNVVNDFTSGKIDALAARNTILQKATDYVKKVATTNLHTGAAMAGFGLLHNGLDAAFQDSQGGRDVSLAQTANDAIENFKTGFIGGTPLSMFAAIGSDSKLSGKVIREMAQDPDKYAQIINDQTKLNPNLQNANAEKLQNLQDLSSINNDLEQTNLTDRQKEKYLVQALNQKVWERKAANTTDDVIKKDYLNNAAKSAKIKNDIYSGLDKATDHENYQKPTENEIPKPTEEAGATNGEVDKNIQPTEAGAIKPNKGVEVTDAYRTANVGNHEGQDEFAVKDNGEVDKTKPTDLKDQQKENISKWTVPLDEGMKDENGNPIAPTGDTMAQSVGRVIGQWMKDKNDADGKTGIVAHSSVLKMINSYEELKDKPLFEGADWNKPETFTPDQVKAYTDQYNSESTNNGDVQQYENDNGKKIVVVRHGQTDDNLTGKFRTPDTQLTDKGREQAKEAGEKLKSLGIEKLKTSDYDRAIESSNIINDVLKGKKDLGSTIPLKNNDVDFESKKADIEKRRKEELENTFPRRTKENQKKYDDLTQQLKDVKRDENGNVIDKEEFNRLRKEIGEIPQNRFVQGQPLAEAEINKRYNKELSDLEKSQTEKSGSTIPLKVEGKDALKDVESTTKAIEDLGEDGLKNLQDKVGKFDAKTIAEKYHLYKGLRTNPDLVKSVEDAISPKKDLSLQSQNDNNAELEKQLPNTLSPTEKQGSLAGGEANAEATAITGAIHKAVEETGTGGKKLSPDQVRQKEEAELKKYAKDKGILIENNFGEPDHFGNEQDVYVNKDGKTVTKVNDNPTHDTWNDFFHKIAIHNSLFPDVAYTLKGFSERDGHFAAVLEQPLITKGEEPVKFSEVKDELGKMGFEPSTDPKDFSSSEDYKNKESGNVFENKKTGVKVSDLHGQNVIKGTDGKIHFIDPIITLSKDRIDNPEKYQNIEPKEPIIEQPPENISKDVSIEGNKEPEPEKKEPPPNTPIEDIKKEEPKGENKVGVSHKSLTELAKKLGLKEPERGEYIEPHEYAERGRQLLKAGATLDDVNNTSNDLHDRIAIARAHLEDLTEAADKIGKTEGIKSDEYKEAAKKVEDYYLDKVKKLGTLAHRAFVSLQGERDLNTGSFTAVKKAFEANKGSKATDEQTKKIVELTKNVEDLRQQNKDLEDKLVAATEKDINGEKPTEPKPKGKFEKQAKDIADKFRKLKTKGFKFKDENGNEVDLTKMGVGWNDLVELGAKAIEATGKVADGVAAIVEKVKDSDFYVKLSNEGKKLFEKQLTEHFEGVNKSESKLADLHEMFADRKSTDKKFSPDEAKALWDYGKEEYLNKGVPYRDMISYVANDTGLKFDQVFSAITSPKTKPIADEAWIKQRNLRRAETKTKDFVDRANKSTFTKVIEAPDQIMRGTAVYGHGGLFVGTHAGMTLTDLPRAKYTVKAFLNGYKFGYGNDAAYERSMQKLQDRQNYTLAQRAGLQNNPNETDTDQYQKAQKIFGKLGGIFKKIGESGVKGFNSIKVLRQDLFDDHYNRLNAAEKADPETARSIAELVNNATGATNLDLKLRDKKGNVVVDPDKIMFAANMEAARWEKLTKNPIKATGIALKALLPNSKATPAEKVFAKVWASRVGWELATYASLAGANALIQSKTNPKNPVNLTDPTKPDYFKFKVGNTDINMTSGMLGAIDFVATLAYNSMMTKKQRRGDNVLQADAKSAFTYGRGKLSPFAATVVDLKTGTDYGNNTLPYNSDKPQTGKHQLTWSEYAWEKAPIPVADAAKKVQESMMDNGMSKAKSDDYLKGLLAFAEAGTTGFRISDSYQRPTKFTDEDKNDPVFKYWINKVGNLPEVSDANTTIHDTKTKKLISISESPKKEEYDKEHKLQLKQELSIAKNRQYVYADDYAKKGESYGNIRIDWPVDEKGNPIDPTYPLHKVYFSLQPKDKQQELNAKILSNAQDVATIKAKMKVFNER